jgi:hypothetical protein
MWSVLFAIYLAGFFSGYAYRALKSYYRRQYGWRLALQSRDAYRRTSSYR